mmetsp:Transcript_9008/g.26205  ORF Transcript_9008/g.26205 Transcript_9008/m.26205 type:complete len:292 (+) Transcript_9008:498-1373(+)
MTGFSLLFAPIFLPTDPPPNPNPTPKDRTPGGSNPLGRVLAISIQRAHKSFLSAFRRRGALDGLLLEVVKIRVRHGGLGGDALARVVAHHLLEQVHAGLLEARHELANVQARPVREGRVPVLQRRAARPDLLVRRAEDAEDLEELVDLRVARQERALRGALGEDRANGPHVHGRRVGLAAHEDLRRAVPERHHLVRQRPDGRAESAREAEVRELELAVARHEQVLRLQVAVHHAARVAEREAAADLEGVGLDQHRVEQRRRRLHVLLQVLVNELEDEVQLAVILHAVAEPI